MQAVDGARVLLGQHLQAAELLLVHLDLLGQPRRLGQQHPVTFLLLHPWHSLVLGHEVVGLGVGEVEGVGQAAELVAGGVEVVDARQERLVPARPALTSRQGRRSGQALDLGGGGGRGFGLGWLVVQRGQGGAWGNSVARTVGFLGGREQFQLALAEMILEELELVDQRDDVRLLAVEVQALQQLGHLLLLPAAAGGGRGQGGAGVLDAEDVADVLELEGQREELVLVEVEILREAEHQQVLQRDHELQHRREVADHRLAPLPLPASRGGGRGGRRGRGEHRVVGAEGEQVLLLVLLLLLVQRGEDEGVVLLLQECVLIAQTRHLLDQRLDCPAIARHCQLAVDLGAVDDGRGARGEAEGVQGLVVVGGRGRETGQQHRQSVAPEGILQQARQLRLSVGHVDVLGLCWLGGGWLGEGRGGVAALLAEGRDYVAQGEESLVDAHALLEDLASRLSLLGSFRTSKIY